MYSDIALIPFKFFRHFFDIKHSTSEIEINMSNPFHAESIILNIINQIENPLAAYTWIKTYQYIYKDIKLIKTIVYVSLSIIIIISCCSIASISFILISKKIKEISILKSMGANNLLIQLTFLYYGFRFILMGSLTGLFIGIITVLNFHKLLYFLKKLFNNNIILNNLYNSDFLFLELRIYDIFIIILLIIIIGLLTNLYPSYYASTINPSKILKEY